MQNKGLLLESIISSLKIHFVKIFYRITVLEEFEKIHRKKTWPATLPKDSMTSVLMRVLQIFSEQLLYRRTPRDGCFCKGIETFSAKNVASLISLTLLW